MEKQLFSHEAEQVMDVRELEAFVAAAHALLGLDFPCLDWEHVQVTATTIVLQRRQERETHGAATAG